MSFIHPHLLFFTQRVILIVFLLIFVYITEGCRASLCSPLSLRGGILELDINVLNQHTLSFVSLFFSFISL